MASKKRGGLSKREYAAKQMGGVVNYKTGKISAPAKKSSGTGSRGIASSSGPFAKYTSMNWGAAAEEAKKAGIDISTGSAFDLAMNKKYNPFNYAVQTGTRFQPTRGGVPIYGQSEEEQRSQGGYKLPDGSIQGSKRSAPVPTLQPPSGGGSAGMLNPPSQSISTGAMPSSPLLPAGQGENGTVRQLIGRGFFSSGLFGNGAGLTNNNNLNAQLGVSTGPSWVQEQLNRMFGINTAQAAEEDAQPKDIVRDHLFTRGSGTPYAGTGGLGNNDLTLGKAMGISRLPSDANPAKNEVRLAQENQHVTGGSADATWELPQQAQQLWGMFQQLKALKNTKPAPQAGLGGSYNASQSYNQSNSQVPNDMQKAIKSYLSGFGDDAKMQKKALEELIKSIEASYATSTREGQETLDKSKTQDLLKLNAMFNFGNSDPNDEQRVQYNQRTQSDYATQQADLMRRLAEGKAQEISRGKQGYFDKMSAIQNAQREAQFNVAKLLQDFQQKQFENSLRMRSGGGGKTPTWYQALNDENQLTGTYTIDPYTGQQKFVPNPTPFQVKSKVNNDPLGIGSFIRGNGQNTPAEQEQVSADTDGNPMKWNPFTGRWEYL